FIRSVATAGGEGQRHHRGQEKCKNLFHLFITSVSMDWYRHFLQCLKGIITLLRGSIKGANKTLPFFKGSDEGTLVNIPVPTIQIALFCAICYDGAIRFEPIRQR